MILQSGKIVCAANVASCRARLRFRVRAVTPNTLSLVSISEAPGRNPELQAALDELFEGTIRTGRRRVHTEEIKEHIDRIQELGSRLGLNRINPEWNDGAFRGLLTSIHAGIDDENQCTMARLTFGKVEPKDLMVQLDQAEAAGLAEGPDQIKGPAAGLPEDPARAYALVSYFKILSNGVFGRLTAKGLYGLDEQDPSKLHVTFAGLLLEPAFPDSRSLELWREALAADNPGMGPDGALYIPLQPRPKAFVRYMVMEPDLQLAITHRGSLITMQRVPLSE